MEYKIYVIKNTINDKVYVGYTGQTYEARSGEYKDNSNPLPFWPGYETCPNIRRAMIKYGKNNFYYETIDTTDSKWAAKELENQYIDKLDSIRNGYNIIKNRLTIFTKEQINEIIKMYVEEKKSCEQISNVQDCDRKLISYTLKKNGIKVRSFLPFSRYSKIELTKEEKQEIVNLYNTETATIDEMTEIFQIGRRIIKKALEDNIKIRSPQSHTSRGLEKIGAAHKGIVGTFKGRHHTEESNEKNRQAHLGSVPANKRFFTPEEELDICSQYKTKSLALIRNQYKTSKDAIKEILSKYNIPIRKNNIKKI